MIENTTRNEFITRDEILKLLSDGETARLSTMAGERPLSDGEQYVDLQQLADGVQRIEGTGRLNMSHLLPRRAVHDATWSKICSKLGVTRGR